MRKVHVITGKSEDVLNCRGYVSAIAISPDSRFLGVGTSEHGALVFNLLTGEKRTLPYSTSITAVSFSPNGRLLAIGGEDGFVKIIDSNTGSEADPSLNSGEPIKSITFSDDGTKLAAEGANTSIRIFDLATGAETAWISDPGLKSLMFDGHDILTVSFQSNSIRVHRHALDVKELAHQTCLLLSKNIEPETWKSYFPSEPYHKTCAELP
jgi:WD40 repeat protein